MCCYLFQRKKRRIWPYREKIPCYRVNKKNPATVHRFFQGHIHRLPLLINQYYIQHDNEFAVKEGLTSETTKFLSRPSIITPPFAARRISPVNSPAAQRTSCSGCVPRSIEQLNRIVSPAETTYLMRFDPGCPFGKTISGHRYVLTSSRSITAGSICPPSGADTTIRSSGDKPWQYSPSVVSIQIQRSVPAFPIRRKELLPWTRRNSFPVPRLCFFDII